MTILSISNAVVQEADRQFMSFEVTLSEPALDTVSFTYRALEGTANSTDLDEGFDRNGLTRGTAVIAPGQTSFTISIEANTDSIDELDESVIMQLTDLSENATFSSGEDVLRATGVILDNDGAGPNLSLFVSDPIMTEGDAGAKNAVFEVRLSRPATEAFSVDYTTRDISARAGEDYTPRIGTLDFVQGEEVKFVSVPVLGDVTAERTESFALVVTPPPSPGLGVAGLVGEAVLLDDDTSPGPVVSISNAVVQEGDRYFMSFEVTLSEPALDTVSFNYRALEGTANSSDLDEGFDRNGLTRGVVEFAPGVTSRTIYIEANTDSTDERDESVIMQLTNLSENASFNGGEDNLRATGVILDNDGAGPNLSLFVSDTIMTEGDGGTKNAVFEVRLSRPATEAFSVNYTTRDISARAGEDYTANLGTLEFAPGEEVKSVTVQVRGDTTPEQTESFALVVSSPASPSTGIVGLVGEAVLLDDDTSPGPVVSISSAIVEESDRRFMSFEVTLSEPALDTVTFTYRTLEGTANSSDLDEGFDRSNLTFGVVQFVPGVTSRTIFIEANTDSTDERDESIVLKLTNLSENASFDGGENSLSATGIILDNDGTSAKRALFVSDPVLTEGDSGTKNAVFEVRLSRPATEAFSVDYTTRDVTAVAGQDYAPRIGTLSFAPGEEVKSVTVPVFGDRDVELAESFSLVVTLPGSPSIGTAGLAGEATILDDDTSPGPVVSVSNAVVEEADRQFMSFEVTLSEASSSPVSLTYRAREGTGTGNDLDDGFGFNGRTSGVITIPPGQTSWIIYIEANTDSTDERDESIFLELSGLSGASFADGAPSVQAVGFILDNDGVGPNRAISIAPTITREPGMAVQEYEIPVVMSQTASVALSFDVAALDQSAMAGLDYRLVDRSITFQPGETTTGVRVQILGDATDENDESFALSITTQEGVPFVGVIPAQEVVILNGPRIPTAGNDVLEGTPGPDQISLLAGDDFYDGLAGDDIVRGMAGDDVLIGGPGNDILFGQLGNDFLVGGASSGATGTAGAQVYRIYQATLDRAPDTGGFEGWVDRLESGARSVLDVVTGFVASAEFQNVYGTLDNRGFVTLLYDNVLERAPDQAGLDGWLQRMSNGTARENVVVGFSESAEFKAGTRVEASAYTDAMDGRAQSVFLDDVFRLYQATLDRAPDAAGLEGWSTRLADGQSYVSIAAGFTGSAEFVNTYGNLGNGAFVEQLYRNVLDREADQAGLEGWLSRLNNGDTREDVVRGFAQGQEFIANTKASFEAYMKIGGGDVLNGGTGSDTLYSGSTADRFVFDAREDGTNVVLQLDTWDALQFNSFGYGSAADALSQMRVTGSDVRFNDQGVEIVFAGTDLATVQEADFLFA